MKNVMKLGAKAIRTIFIEWSVEPEHVLFEENIKPGRLPENSCS